MKAAAYVVGALVITVVALARQSGVPATSSIWAEDGNLFYVNALESSVWHNVWAPYNGYEQLLPRLVAQVAALLPVRDASTVFAVCGAFGLALVCCAVFHMAQGLIPAAYLRALLCAAMVLLPVGTAEVLNDTVNLPWWLFFGTFWAVVWRPRSAAGAVLAGVMGFLAVASNPLAVFYLPLCGLKALTYRRGRDHGATIGLAVATLYQLIARIGAAKEKPFLPGPLHGIVQDYAIRNGLSMVGGNRAVWWLASRHMTLAALLGALVLAVVLLLGWVVPSVRPFTVVTFLLSVVLFVLPVWLRNASVAMYDSSLATGSRYVVVPLLLLTSVVFVVAGAVIGPGQARASRPLGRRAQARRRSAAPLITGALLVALVPAWVNDFGDANARSTGPNWPDQITAGTAACRAHPGRGARVNIDPLPWFTVIPCQYLVAGGGART